MGGGPKINTGVSWVDNTSNNALGVATGGLAGNSLDSVGKNLERNAQTMINTTVALTQPGGLNNIGQTMAQQAAIMLSGGLADNNDMKKVQKA